MDFDALLAIFARAESAVLVCAGALRALLLLHRLLKVYSARSGLESIPLSKNLPSLDFASCSPTSGRVPRLHGRALPVHWPEPETFGAPILMLNSPQHLPVNPQRRNSASATTAASKSLPGVRKAPDKACMITVRGE